MCLGKYQQVESLVEKLTRFTNYFLYWHLFYIQRTGDCCHNILISIFILIRSGVKEVDIAASLEHIRDQRMESVQTREQFEFVLSAVAEEVQALLKALP